MTFSLEVISQEVTTSTSDFGGITFLEFRLLEREKVLISYVSLS